MYATGNPKTKKALKVAVAEGQRVEAFSPGPFPCPTNGRVSLEGPHYPAAHTWYANAEVRDGVIVRVIS